MRLYLDASALVKLVKHEPESQALRHYLGSYPRDDLVTSALSRVEVVRAVSPGGQNAVDHAARVLGRVDQLTLTEELLDRAARSAPSAILRSLDALHLASAQLAPDLRAVVTYDRRMAAAAADLQLPVVAPA